MGAQQDPHQLRRSVRAANRDPGGAPGSSAVVVLESAGHPAPAEQGVRRVLPPRQERDRKLAIRGSRAEARFDSVEWPKDGDGARWLPEHRRVYLQRHRPGQGSPAPPVAGRVKTIQIKRQGPALDAGALVRRRADQSAAARPAARPASMSASPVSPPPATASTSTIRAGRVPPRDRVGRRRSSGCQRAKRRSTNRDRKRETVAAQHRKVANQRKDFHHKQAALASSHVLRPAGGGGPADRQHAAAGQTRARSRQSRAASPNAAGRSPDSVEVSVTPAGAGSSRFCAPKRKTLGAPGLRSTPAHLRLLALWTARWHRRIASPKRPSNASDASQRCTS